MKATKLTKLAFETPLTKVHHTKANTTRINPTTASTNSPDNSVFLKQFMDKNVMLKQMATSCNVIKNCCPQFPANLKSIFASDKRRAEAVNYVKKLRSNKSVTNYGEEPQVKNRKDSMSKIFNESPIRAVPPSSQKNILHQPCNPVTSRDNYSNMCQYSTPNMLASYTSRVPQNHPTFKKRINHFEMDHLLDDDMYDNNYNDFEREEVFFYDDKDNDDEIQILYSRNENEANDNGKKQSTVYKPLDIHIPEIPQTFSKKNPFKGSSQNKFNGYVITEYDNGNIINEYECTRLGNWKRINANLLKDKVSLCGKMLQFVDLNDYEKAKDIINEYESNKRIKTRQIGTNTVNKERKVKLVKEQVEELSHIAQQEPKKVMRLRRQKIEKFSYIAEEKESNDSEYNYLTIANAVNVKYTIKPKKKVIKKQTAFQFEYVQTKSKRKYNVGVNTTVFPFKVCRNVQLVQIKEMKGKIQCLELQQQRAQGFSQVACVNKMFSENGMNTEQEELCVDNKHSVVEYIANAKEYVDKDVITDLNLTNVQTKVIQTDMNNCIMENKETNTQIIDYTQVCECEGFDVVCEGQLLRQSKEDIHTQTDVNEIETKEEGMITDNKIVHTMTNIQIEYVHGKEDIQCQNELNDKWARTITTEHIIEFIHDKVNAFDVEIQTDNNVKDNETNTETNTINEVTSNDVVELICNKIIPHVASSEIQTDVIDSQHEETNTELILNANEIIVNDNIEYINIRTQPHITNTEMQTEENDLIIKPQNTNIQIQSVIQNEYIIPYKELQDEETNTQTVNEITTNETFDFVYNKTLPYFEIQNQAQFHCEQTQTKANINGISSNNNTVEYLHEATETKDNETNTSLIFNYEISATNSIEHIHTKAPRDTSHMETQTDLLKEWNHSIDIPLLTSNLVPKSVHSVTEQSNDEYPILITQPKSEQQSEVQTQDYQSNSNQYSSLEQPPISIEGLPEQEPSILKSKTNKPHVRIIPKEEAETLNLPTQTAPSYQDHFAFNDSCDEIIIPSASVKEKIRRIYSTYGIHSDPPDDITVPAIMTVLSHKPVASKKKKKFTYSDFNESYSKATTLKQEEQSSIIAARSKALLFRQKLKKNGNSCCKSHYQHERLPVHTYSWRNDDYVK